jgi:predicted  nucleic acid-binding Zn-ribbon protein
MKNTTELKWSDDDIAQIREAITHLLEINETLNANIIAMNAKLENEEKKVKHLSNKVSYYEDILNINTKFTA